MALCVRETVSYVHFDIPDVFTTWLMELIRFDTSHKYVHFQLESLFVVSDQTKHIVISIAFIVSRTV